MLQPHPYKGDGCNMVLLGGCLMPCLVDHPPSGAVVSGGWFFRASVASSNARAGVCGR